MNTPRLHRSLIAAPLLALSLLVLGGCVAEDRVVVRSERPRDRVEVVTVRPSARHTWVAGRWEAHGERWDWLEGRWEIR